MAIARPIPRDEPVTSATRRLLTTGGSGVIIPLCFAFFQFRQARIKATTRGDKSYARAALPELSQTCADLDKPARIFQLSSCRGVVQFQHSAILINTPLQQSVGEMIFSGLLCGFASQR